MEFKEYLKRIDELRRVLLEGKGKEYVDELLKEIPDLEFKGIPLGKDIALFYESNAYCGGFLGIYNIIDIAGIQYEEVDKFKLKHGTLYYKDDDNVLYKLDKIYGGGISF